MDATSAKHHKATRPHIPCYLGDEDPATDYAAFLGPQVWWWDTSTGDIGTLKKRNDDNNAWDVLVDFDAFATGSDANAVSIQGVPVTEDAPAPGSLMGFDGTQYNFVPAGVFASASHHHNASYSAVGHTHTSAGITDFAEAVDDRMDAFLVAGTNITLDYDDEADTLTISSSGGSAEWPADPEDGKIVGWVGDAETGAAAWVDPPVGGGGGGGGMNNPMTAAGDIIMGTGASSDVALGKTATAGAHDGGYIPGKAVDGINGTQWSSGSYNPAVPLMYLQVDLEAEYTIGSYRLHRDGTYALTADVEIQGSHDDLSWDVVVAITGNGTADIIANLTTPATYRYWRVVWPDFAGGYIWVYALELNLAAGEPVRRAVGEEGTVLTVVGGYPDWAEPAGGGHIIQEGTTPMPARANLRFTGDGVSVTENVGDDVTIVTINAGEGGGGGGGTPWEYPPTLADFDTWINQGTATEVQSGTGLKLEVPIGNATGPRGRVQDLPAGDFCVSAAMSGGFFRAGGYPHYALSIAGADNKVISMAVCFTGGGWLYEITRWNDNGSFNSQVAAIGQLIQYNPIWLRIAQISGTRYFFMSPDGSAWTQLWHETADDYITPTRAGMTVQSDGTGNRVTANLYNFHITDELPAGEIALWSALGGGSGGGGGGAVAGDIILTGAYADLPAAEEAGRLYLPNNGIVLLRDNGTAWDAFGPIWPLTDPNAPAWAWVNQGTGTLNTEKRSRTIEATATAGGENWLLNAIAAPATPYKITAAIMAHPMLYEYGIGFRDSVSGKLHMLMMYLSGGGSKTIYSSTFHTSTSWAGHYVSLPALDLMTRPLWLQIEDDGTNRICRFSQDGKTWYNFHSIGRTNHLTANQLVFGINNNGQKGYITLLSWKQE